MHRGRLLTLTGLGLAALAGCGKVVGLDEYDEVTLVSGLTVFDAYRFQSGAASFRVDATAGVLANDLAGETTVVPRSIGTLRGGRVALAADGSFSYRPPGAPGVFFGDDEFPYTLRSGRTEDTGRVRVTVNPRALDVATLPESPGWGYGIVGAENDLLAATQFGLAPAGDVDGDGREDVLLGAPLTTELTGGRAYIALGKADDTTIVLGAPRARTITLNSIPGDGLGTWQSGGAGDVNGDGLDDVILAAPSVTDVAVIPALVPRAYVVFGSAEPFELDLSELAAGSERGFVIEGPIRDDGELELFAFGASSAGDFNGDGFDDVIVTAPRSSHEDRLEAGAAYVVFGGPAPRNVSIPPATGAIPELPGVLTIVGRSGDILGFGVAAAGDTNGDGLDDVVLGGRLAEEGAEAITGGAYVVYGTRGSGPLRLGDDVDGSTMLLIAGAQPGDRAGWPVAGPGDMNGDGFDDVVISSPGRTSEVASSAEPIETGVLHVVFGGQALDRVSLADIEAEQGGGFAILGSPALSGSGASMSGGDVDGDGLNDLLVGTIPELVQSRSYLVFGKAGTETVSLAALELGEPGGLSLFDVAPSAEGTSLVSGAAVASGVDLNADGLDDFLIGAAGYSLMPLGGAALAVFGWDMTGAVGLRGPALVGTSDDDTLEVPEAPVIGFRGGNGLDTLELADSGRTLDLTRLDTFFESLEIIDVRGSGPNAVILHDASLRRIPASRPALPYELAKTLVVLGDGDDTLYFDLSGYAQLGSNQGRLVYAREGRYYGLELSPGMRVTWPPP